MKKALIAVLTIAVCAAVVLFVRTDGDEYNARRGVVIERPAPAAPSEATRDVAAAPPAVAPVPRPTTPLPSVPAMRANNRLVIGRISTNVRKHWPRLEAMANYLAAELAAQGVTGVDVRMVDTMEDMREALRAGEIDLLSETAFAAIELTQDGSAEMLMREWKSGVSDYHTVIFARRDSGISGLGDLVDRTITFEDRGSTSGYLVPRASIARQGFNLMELDATLARPTSGSIGFTFGDDEETVVGRVVRGFADAGAISNLDWADEDEVSETDRRDLVAIYETDPIIRSIVLVRSTLDSNVKTRLALVLEQMHETDVGMETLREYWKVARFDRIEGPALDSLLTARVLHETFRSF